MVIGVPKEIMHGEARVAATPETCASFIADGHSVLVEKGAGVGSYFLDEAYLKAGVTLVDDVADLYKKSDLILKVKEPLFNKAKNCSEISMMHSGQYLITFIHPASPVNHAMVKEMAEKGIVSFTLDGVPRISRAQNMDALTSMSTCAGYKGIMIAGNLLPRFMPQIFSAVGMIKPVNVLVIGTGVGGLQALATAKRLGAVVYAADIRPAAREQAQSLGAKVIDVDVDEKEAVGEGGYALHLKESTLQHEREKLVPHIKDMDVIFASALVPGKIAPKIITEEMVKTMKHGSVIVDISIDQGGNCEITPPGEIETKHGVNLVGIKNIPGMLPESSTWMFAKNIYNLAKYLIRGSTLSVDTSDEIVRGILTTNEGKIVHVGAREAMGL